MLRISPNTKCHLEQIKRFECIAFVKLPKALTKFSSVAIKTVLVAHTSTGYILWHPNTRKFLESRHVRFLEKLVYNNVYKNQNIDVDNSTPFEVCKELKDDEGVNRGTEKPNSETSEKSYSDPRKRGRPRKTNSGLENNKSELNQEKLLNNQVNEGPITRNRAKKIIDSSFARYTKVSEIKEIREYELGHILLASIQKDSTIEAAIT